MTDRLYYDDPFMREFDATVLRVTSQGSRHAVWLDRSCFYPTSGGQPHDTGALDSYRVVDVLDEDGDVVHVLEGEHRLEDGQQVRGAIDWPRRFDHMQQHTGQHVLSAAFARLFDAATVSFHLGVEVSAIDLAREMTAAEIAAAEDEANRIVWEDRPITIRYASAEEAGAMGLRKESRRAGTLRLIDVEGFDLSACGGSHVARTGSIGMIAIGSWERFKGGQRLEFLCGGRALSRFRSLRDVIAASTRLLSVLPAELPAAIDRLQTEAREQRRTLTAQQMELAAFRAADLANSAETFAGWHLVARAVDADAPTLKALAAAVVSRPGFVVLLVSPASPSLVVVARSRDASVACDGIVKGLIARFGGRGGGKPDLAQAGGLTGSAEDVLAEGRRLMST